MRNFVIIMILLLGGCTSPNNNYNGHFKRVPLWNNANLRDVTFESLFFFNSEHGVAAGQKIIFNNQKSDGNKRMTGQHNVSIYNTFDGGYNWNEVVIEEGSGKCYEFKYINNVLYANLFFYKSERYPTGYSKIYTSKDMGLSWREKTGFKNISDYYFRDSLNGIIWDRANFYATNDGGVNYGQIPQTYRPYSKKLLELNDSTAIFVLYHTEHDIQYLVSYDYVNNKEIYKFPIPQKSPIYHFSYSDGLLSYAKDSTIYFSSIISDSELKPVLQHKFRKDVIGTKLAKSGNNACIYLNVGIVNRLTYFSRDGGKSWTEIKYFRGSYSPEYMLFDNDTILNWSRSGQRDFNYIKIDPAKKITFRNFLPF